MTTPAAAASTTTAERAASATTAAAATPPPPAQHAAGDPDLGPNVYVFDSSMDTDTVQSTLDAIFAQQKQAEFGTGRYAVLFKPGGYDVDVNLGYYTQVAGLGAQPADVTISNTLHVDGDAHGKGTLTNFWRGAENIHPVPRSGTDRWAVSQATFYRRIYLTGNLQLDDGGYSSGGFIADSLITGQVSSGTQQQWITRNSVVGGWLGFNWNIVFVGTDNAPATSFPSPPFTNVARTPVVREKPFLHVDKAGAWQVFVPAVRRDSHNTSWEAQRAAGTDVPLGDFHIAQPGASAAELNSALAQGKHLLITPGVYHLAQPLKITEPDTVVLGLGLATLIPDGGVTALDVADVDGVKIAGLLVDAGAQSSDALVRVGPDGSRHSHTHNPSSLHDVFVRVGGAGVGKAKNSIVVNSDDVIIDNTWLWRADHGSGVGWTKNTSDTGLLVSGDDVTVYGLFVEHHQKAQVSWSGERGRTYFFQNEMPYDPPNQAAWNEGAHRGWPAYEVADGVREHEAWGLGSYCNLTSDPTIVADRAFAAPRRSGVRFHSMLTFSLGGGQGTIAHVINTTGGPSDAEVGLAKVTSYP
ncbi:coagulation factor 5/8 type domain-containing protein [Streptomyces sp. NBC_01497]|uniref:coagulation factor 5/8 type domain-containing protein n=1 Tax=Streptomyces sp. NBC_01497 TaxID=2903885 RepID=UPI002E33A0DE|nr:coagulation factor 5/8 type domain-containing protein [Streptomyces sp. NBC_01497]